MRLLSVFPIKVLEEENPKYIILTWYFQYDIVLIQILAGNNAPYKKGQKRISDGVLVAITLMIAESNPEEKISW